MARGEVKIAKMINPIGVSDFNSLKELVSSLLNIIAKGAARWIRESCKFWESAVIDETNIVSLQVDHLEEKQGLAFVNTLIYSFELGRLVPGINIKTPVTAIIVRRIWYVYGAKPSCGTKLKLRKTSLHFRSYFLRVASVILWEGAQNIYQTHNKPLAYDPRAFWRFHEPAISGIFGTYLLPNNHYDPEYGLSSYLKLLKLVFSSIYSRNARTYFEAIIIRLSRKDGSCDTGSSGKQLKMHSIHI